MYIAACLADSDIYICSAQEQSRWLAIRPVGRLGRAARYKRTQASLAAGAARPLIAAWGRP
eukprot:11833430-Heterocapsa_arctica.AAC.1